VQFPEFRFSLAAAAREPGSHSIQLEPRPKSRLERLLYVTQFGNGTHSDTPGVGIPSRFFLDLASPLSSDVVFLFDR